MEEEPQPAKTLATGRQFFWYILGLTNLQFSDLPNWLADWLATESGGNGGTWQQL